MNINSTEWNEDAGFKEAAYASVVIFKLAVLMIMTASCAGSEVEREKAASTVSADCSTITRESADNCIRLNQIQVLGTHNSYKLSPDSSLIEILNRENPGWSENLQYSHRPLREQLDELGIRQLELDIFADPKGGLYSDPAGAVMANDEQFRSREGMNEPGFKVLHIPDIDYRSTCSTFTGCLQEVHDWSIEHQNHFPIMVLIELKDSKPDDTNDLKFTNPVKIDQNNIHDVDREIWSVFSKNHVITPDDVRGDYSTLEKAILEKGWPSLSKSRGKVIFALDNTDRHKEDYLSASPNLSGRAMFVSSRPGEPTAGFIKMNDVVDENDLIKKFSKEGYLIRTRADIPTSEGRSGDTTRRDLALNSGAQYISTDYPETSPFGSGYIVELPETEHHGRCNPVSAPPECRDEYITE